MILKYESSESYLYWQIRNKIFICLILICLNLDSPLHFLWRIFLIKRSWIFSIRFQKHSFISLYCSYNTYICMCKSAYIFFPYSFWLNLSNISFDIFRVLNLFSLFACHSHPRFIQVGLLMILLDIVEMKCFVLRQFFLTDYF